MQGVNRCATAPEPVAADACQLRRLWDVREGRRYDIMAGVWHWSPPRLIAVRTHGGRGIMEVEGGVEHVLDGGTLLLLESRRIRRYRCADDKWEFWWFEFLPSPGVAPERLERVSRLELEPLEWELFSTVFANLCQESEAARKLRRGGLQYVCASHWRLRHGAALGQPRSHARIAELLDKARGAPERRWSVAELAKACQHERAQLPRRVLAGSRAVRPKALPGAATAGRGARRCWTPGGCNIKEVAERFGYSSEFHFSRNFSRQFGAPPSRRTR